MLEESLRRRFSPLILLNAPGHLQSQLKSVIPNLTSSSYELVHKDETGQVERKSQFLRFMPPEEFIILHADARHIRESTNCIQSWRALESIEISDDFMGEAKRRVVPEVCQIIHEALMNDGLSSFDEPVAVVHLASSLGEFAGLGEKTADLPISKFVEIQVVIGESSECRSVPELSADCLKAFMNDTLSADIVPHMSRCVQEAQARLASKASQGSFGLATRLYSMSKKYLITQNPLLGLKHSDETVVMTGTELSISTISLTDADAVFRRAADMLFMRQDFKQAAMLYEALRKDAQVSKSWNVTASAQQMFLLSQMASGAISALPRQDVDMIVQQYLLQPQTHFTALQLLYTLMLAKSPKDLIFLLCSRLVQSGVDVPYKLHLWLVQAEIALNLAIPKKRLALLLFERFASACESIGLYKLSLAIYSCAYAKLKPSVYFITLWKRILSLSIKLNAQLEQTIASGLLRQIGALKEEEVIYCWASLGSGPLQSPGLQICEVCVNGKPATAREFSLSDYELIRNVTDYVWCKSGEQTDPLEVILATEENVAPLGERVNIAIEVYNPFDFELELGDVLACAEDTYSSSSECYKISPKCSEKISFEISSEFSKAVKLAKLSFQIRSFKMELDLQCKGQRLTLTQAHRLRPTYSECRLLWIRFVDSMFESTLEFSTPLKVAVHQECILELTMQTNITRKATVLLLRGEVIPLDYAVQVQNDQSLIKDVNVDAGNQKKVLLQTCAKEAGSLELVIAIVTEGHRPLLNRITLQSESLITITATREFTGHAGSLIALTLVNASKESVQVFEASLEAISGSCRPLGIDSGFSLRPSVPFVMTFRHPEHNSALVLRLQDGRILRIPIESGGSPIFLRLSGIGSASYASQYRVQPVTAKLHPNQTLDLADSSGTLILGHIGVAPRPSELQVDLTLLSNTPDFAAISSAALLSDDLIFQ